MSLYSKATSVRGFTLIELLVVISIIGLLSSIALASLNAAREKARIAAGQKFHTATYRSFGANTAASYTFEDATGSTAFDRSGNNAHFTSGQFTVSPAGIYGNALSFSGTNESYARTSAYVNASMTGKWTLAAWIKPASGAGQRIFFSFGLPYVRLEDGRLFFAWSNAGCAGAQCNSTAFCPTLPLAKVNEWSHVAISSNGTHVTAYFDGREVCKALSSASAPNYTLTIGNHSSGTYPYAGLMDEVNVYTESLLARDVQELYLAGLPRHPVAVK